MKESRPNKYMVTTEVSARLFDAVNKKAKSLNMSRSAYVRDVLFKATGETQASMADDLFNMIQEVNR